MKKEKAGNKMKIFKKDGSKSSQNSFFQPETAAASIVAAILLLAIVFTVFSIIQIGYIPEWKADVEHSHMVDIWEDMTKLKSKIDRISILLMADTNSSLPPIITTIPLRTSIKDTPVLGSLKSTGTVSINPEACRMILTTNSISKGINCGTIAYHSNNRYYIDQVFAYENGALILDQREKAAIKRQPLVKVYEASPGYYNFSFDAIEINSPKNSVSSNSECSIRLKKGNFSTFYPASDASPFILEIDHTDHPDAWEAYFNETMSRAGLKRNVDYDLLIGTDNLKFSFPKAGSANRLEKLYVGKTTLETELVIV